MDDARVLVDRWGSLRYGWGRSVPVVAAVGGHSLLAGEGTSDSSVEYEGYSCSEIGLLVRQPLRRALCRLQGKLLIKEYRVSSSSVGSG